ncbi:hypothetical protein BSLG_004752 [Batrachochytrium salamandrivorans]|nr:hypothetical protein BSLG_004752 [Batrachochytrium salamandrivorans]
MQLLSAITFAVLASSALASPMLAKRANVGTSISNARTTFYGQDFSRTPGGEFSGDVPPYQPYGMGSCGPAFEPKDHNSFIAMGASLYSESLCGKCVKISYKGKTTTGPIVDKCPSCGEGLDLSLGLFANLVGGEANARTLGVINVDYQIIDCGGGGGNDKPTTPTTVKDDSDVTTTTATQEQTPAPAPPQPQEKPTKSPKTSKSAPTTTTVDSPEEQEQTATTTATQEQTPAPAPPQPQEKPTKSPKTSNGGVAPSH